MNRHGKRRTPTNSPLEKGESQKDEEIPFFPRGDTGGFVPSIEVNRSIQPKTALAGNRAERPCKERSSPFLSVSRVGLGIQTDITSNRIKSEKLSSLFTIDSTEGGT